MIASEFQALCRFETIDGPIKTYTQQGQVIHTDSSVFEILFHISDICLKDSPQEESLGRLQQDQGINEKESIGAGSSSLGRCGQLFCLVDIQSFSSFHKTMRSGIVQLVR